MKLSFTIARRYLFSSRLPIALNLISVISVLGITFGTALLFIVLSVFNGFHFLIRDYYQAYDADLRIVPKTGKYVIFSPDTLQKIQSTPGVALVTTTIEGRAIIKKNEKQKIIRLKGVTADYRKVTQIASLIEIGQYGLKTTDGDHTAVIGSGVAYSINASVDDWVTPLELFTVSESADLLTTDPEQALHKRYVYPAGIFNKHQEYDNQYVLVDLPIAQELFEAENHISAYEIKVLDTDQVKDTQKSLSKLLGGKYVVETWYEQHKTMYEILRNEKTIAALVIIFMMILISFNIIGALSMIITEKKKDIGILLTLGALPKTIRDIFIWEGFFIGFVGVCLGMILGISFCMLQNEYHILSFQVSEETSLIVDAFPVKMLPLDGVIVIFTVFTLCLLSAIIPARHASKSLIRKSLFET